MRSLNFLLVPFICNNYDLNHLQDIKEELIKSGHSATKINRIITEDELQSSLMKVIIIVFFELMAQDPTK